LLPEHLIMKNLIYIIAFLTIVSCSSVKETTAVKEEWIQLFNGKDLNDWNPKIRGQAFNVNYKNTFIVEDSVIKVNYAEYDSFKTQFGHLFYKDAFSYYKLRAEYRFVGDQLVDGPGWAFRNSGLMLHSPAPGTMGVDQDFPISIEVQLLGGERERTTANLCTPGTNVVMDGKLFTDHCINSKSKILPGDQWVTVEVHVYGDSLFQHFVNDEMVLEYNAPQYGGGNVSGNAAGLIKEGDLIEGGYISLQSESHPVEFRKVELLNLEGCMDPKAKNFAPWVVKSNPEACVFE